MRKEGFVMAVGLLILRVVVGALFFGHGAQKLFGWFGGHGIDGTAGFMDSLEYRNGRVAAMLAGLTETISGLLLAVGLLTPLAAAGIIGVMVNATATVHWRKGLSSRQGERPDPVARGVRWLTARLRAVFVSRVPGRFSGNSLMVHCRLGGRGDRRFRVVASHTRAPARLLDHGGGV
jgi:putative oxidoreductase